MSPRPADPSFSLSSASTTASSSTSAPAGGVRHVPVTPLQYGMIYHFLREGRGTGVDVVQVEVEFEKGVEVEANRLAEAWRRVVSREPGLRMDFSWDDGEEPRGRIHPPGSIPVEIPVVRLSSEGRGAADGISGSSVPPAYGAYLEADRARGFDLAHGPLFRLALVELDADRRILVWTLHHVLADGWSYRLVLDDVLRLLAADDMEAAEAELPDRPEPEALTAWMAAREDEADRAFWTHALAGVTQPTAMPRLPAGHRTPGRWQYRQGALEPEVLAGLAEVALSLDARINTLLQAAWAVTLHAFQPPPPGGEGGEPAPVVFGAIRGGRAGTFDGADQVVGLFINTVPVAATVAPDGSLGELVHALRDRWVDMRAHEHTPPWKIQQWSSVPSGSRLFESVLNVQAPFWGDALMATAAARAEPALTRVDLHNPLVFPLTVAVNLPDPAPAPGARPSPGSGPFTEGARVRFEFDPGELDASRVEAMLETFGSVLRAMATLVPAAAESTPVDELLRVSGRSRTALLHASTGPVRPLPPDTTISSLFAEAAGRWPTAVAVTDAEVSWTFEELRVATTRVAEALVDAGVAPGDRVAVMLSRGVHLPAALLGVLASGAAYVPVDPEYPEARVRMMLDDASPAAVLTDRSTHPVHRGLERNSGPGGDPLRPVLVMEDLLHRAHDRDADTSPAGLDGPRPESLAYMIYTSGSTGRPKGVMVEHRNVVNFFLAMDEAVGVGPGDRWLAVTSISFDISVLELLWTLTRGATVSLFQARPLAAGADARTARPAMAFSLFFFSAEGEEGEAPPPPGRHRYRLLLEGAQRADELGLAGVWTPERHFHAFGGIYPNPSVTGAAVAALTRNVRIRAGSVVLPLHDSVRVAEEWSVVDNLSDGRVELSFASGWHDRDFVFQPGNFADRKEQMFRQIDEVRTLWRGGTVERNGPSGASHALGLHPRPVQPELPFFVTAGGSPETFRRAGDVGAHLLTHLLGQRPDELEAKLVLYRQAWRDAGHPGEGYVALMLHTYLAPDMDDVRARVAGPFRSYLKTAVGLIQAVADEDGKDLREAELSDDEMEALLEHAFHRYFDTSSLMGDLPRARETVTRLRAMGVDEIACLVDFGVEEDQVLEGLDLLGTLANEFSHQEGASGSAPLRTVTGELVRTGATHLQCTPSQAAMLLAEDDASRALGGLRALLLGGEALPGPLAARLREHLAPGAPLYNMYGPTETTVWSAVQAVTPDPAAAPGAFVPSAPSVPSIPLGPPVVNTTLLVVDEAGELVPPGREGELLIGGAGVVRGYFERPDLTTERFVDSPVPELPGRVYRTGDRVRRRPDGRLDFLGRVDHQVKLRGHRIELGEVEAALLAHPDVASAVVLLHRDTAEAGLSEHLVACLLLEGAPPAQLRSALRHWLRDRLPEIMIPSEFVILEAYPLTPNGKVDRRALAARLEAREKGPAGDAGEAAAASTPARPPAPVAARSTRAAPAPSAPHAPSGTRAAPGQAARLEKAVTALWSTLLGGVEISPSDNFFDLGGHSLLAVRVHGRLTRDFGVALSLVDLFRFPTARQLARHLATLGADATPQGAAPASAPASPPAPAPASAPGAPDLHGEGESSAEPGDPARARAEARNEALEALRARRAKGRRGPTPPR